MNCNGLSKNEAISVKLAEKMLKHPFFVPVLKAYFGGLSNLKKVMRNVTFDFSAKLPANVFAETMRTVKGDPVNFGIKINRNFSTHFSLPSTTESELTRLRFVAGVTIFHEVLHVSLRNIEIPISPDKLQGLFSPEAGELVNVSYLLALSRK